MKSIKLIKSIAFLCVVAFAVNLLGMERVNVNAAENETTVYKGDNLDNKLNNNQVSVTVFNCGGMTSTAMGKGDANIINCGNGHYVLVDVGLGGNSAKEFCKFLNNHCKKINGKINIDAIILSHNHADHIGGLIKVEKYADGSYKGTGEGILLEELKNTSKYNVGTVYFCKSGPVNYYSAIKNNVGKYFNIVKVHTGEKYNIGVGNAHISIFGPAPLSVEQYKTQWNNLRDLSEDNEDDEDLAAYGSMENDCSMAVTVSSDYDNFKGIFLGDMSAQAVENAMESSYHLPGKSSYKTMSEYVNGYHFNFCKFGHHGQLCGNADVQTTKNIYNTYIKADVYAFTTTTKYLIYKYAAKQDMSDDNRLKQWNKTVDLSKSLSREDGNSLSRAIIFGSDYSYSGNIGFYNNLNVSGQESRFTSNCNNRIINAQSYTVCIG